LDYSVLGLVIERPSYGYELSGRFDRRFGGLIEASQAGIYKVLQRLQAEMLIERAQATVATSEGRPRIHYRATSAGTSAYPVWLAKRIRDGGERSELLIRLAATGIGQVEGMLEVLARYEQECMEEIRSQVASGDAIDPAGELFADLIAEERRQSTLAQLRWVTFARERIRAYEAPVV
jgi:DNA-binding PadR family transcriptional regulator